MMDGDLETTLRLTPTARALGQDAVRGLSQTRKTLSPKWLYDARGSALFEQITALPEYYLTRTETAILQQHAKDLARLVPPGGALVELGSGASVKTRLLLDEGAHLGAYIPVDISQEFLLETASILRTLYPHIPVAPVVADFGAPVQFPADLTECPKVGFFPGSTIGNLNRAAATALLARARGWPGAQRFVLGADLVKDPADLVAAYDDAQGVTAAFIKNILVRLNAELGADFDPDAFAYRADWDPDRAQVDMWLRSRKAHSVTLLGTPITFARDEDIHISASRKFTAASLGDLVETAGWQVADLITDVADRFAAAVLETLPGA